MSDEIGWLIERNPEVGDTAWWLGTRYGWARDADMAVRFSRKVDAVRVIESMNWSKTAHATEHLWLSGHAVKVHRQGAGQAGYDRALTDIGYTVSVGMIAAERRRQVEQESWNSHHDDGHVNGELALAAACYAIDAAGRASFALPVERGSIEISIDSVRLHWPFSWEWWKSSSPLRNLVKSGALISAEIDRRLRTGETE